MERSPAPGSEYEMGTRRVAHWKLPTEVTAPAAREVQGVHERGEGVGNDVGVVSGVGGGAVVVLVGVASPDPEGVCGEVLCEVLGGVV
jgi:hypothetical protein